MDENRFMIYRKRDSEGVDSLTFSLASGSSPRAGGRHGDLPRAGGGALSSRREGISQSTMYMMAFFTTHGI